MKLRGPTILLAEDNDDDAFFMERALRKAGIVNPLEIATNGQAALDYLNGVGRYADRERHPLPFIAFIDLKMPYVNGFEVLEWLKAHPVFSDLPAVILSSSNQDSDNQKAYTLGARSYVVKPPTPAALLRLMSSLSSFWGRTHVTGPVMIEGKI